MTSCSRPQLGGRRTRGKKRGGCSNQLGGSAIFPATFGGLGGDVRNYALNSYGGDPTHNMSSSSLFGGAKRRTRGRKSRRRKNKKMLGGNFMPLLGNQIMRA